MNAFWTNKPKVIPALIYALWICLNVSPAFAQKVKVAEPPKPVFKDKDGKLKYTADEKGNRIPDFSYAGFMAGEQTIPEAKVKVIVALKDGDATLRIQSALNYVAKLPLGKDGLRGAVLLEKGRYEIAGSLKINASGVVLRGSGTGASGTLIHATGLDRLGVLRIAGLADRQEEKTVAISSPYVPVNAMKITVADPAAFKAGDQVMIHRPSSKNWIDAIGTGHFGGGITSLGWKAGQREVYWDRKIVSIKGSELTLDAPLTTALDVSYGVSTVSKYNWKGRISHSGVENMKLQSSFDDKRPADEDHRWTGISLENMTDGWVRQIVFEHFAGSAVSVQESANRITVEDCKSLSPVSEIGGERRYTFLTMGGQTLFQRLYSEYGYHDFAVGYCAPGPNAFVQCQAYVPYSFSGTIDSWASGVLFDVVNVEGQALSFMNRGQDGQGAGWTAANSVFWQCTAARIDCYQPPTAQNWAFGNWAQFAGDGYWDSSNEQIQPRSLYYAQLSDRLGPSVDQRAFIMPVETEASSSPQVEVAEKLTESAVKPARQLSDYIDEASERQKISIAANGAKSIDNIGLEKAPLAAQPAAMVVDHGWLLRGQAIVTGERQDVQWWNGSARPYGLKNAKPHLTRFVPGRSGKGLTDDLDETTDSMQKGAVKILEHNYGLWYDRRRDDHQRVRRMDGEVWAPFYELPFARTGQDKAWDGLSKYDLSKYNLWYWSRLKQFADLADQKALVLIHQNYFQHNIIEAGAHYADFPWRTANNINQSGFPEPVPYAGDKRIFMAGQFYDITHPARRELHRAYIRKCLDNFKDNTSVIQSIGAEFTGPLHFVQFWLDTIREWEKETGKHPVIALSTTKDVQDAILADAERAAVVDLIDIRYWHYQADGSVYAPEGGQNLAPRQHARLLKPKKTSFEQVYRAVSAYRLKYPEKAVIYSGDNYGAYGWAVFMAGGSLSNIPGFDQSLLGASAAMKPHSPNRQSDGQYVLADPGKSYVIFNHSAAPVKLDLRETTGNFSLKRINPGTGIVLREEKIKGGEAISLDKLSADDEVIFINKI